MRRPGRTGRRVREAALVAGVVVLGIAPIWAPAAGASRAGALPPLSPQVDVADWKLTLALADQDLVGPEPSLDAHDETTRPSTIALVASPLLEQWSPPVLDYRITAEFGERGSHWTTRHTGLDFLAPRGTPVRAVHDGVVIKLAWHKAYGRMVILEISPGVTIWYCHLDTVSVGLGPVRRGDQLGRIGSSGNATGPHLHLEVRVEDRPTNPWIYLFGKTPGHPGPVPTWLPPVPINTVANLAQLQNR